MLIKVCLGWNFCDILENYFDLITQNNKIFSFWKAVYCALRWLQDVNKKSHSILAGLLAGISVGFYRNSTFILYLTWKTLEVLYYEGIEAGYLMKVPGFASLLYSLSTSILFHAGKSSEFSSKINWKNNTNVLFNSLAVVEPHNLKPSYWKFLMRITGSRYFLLTLWSSHRILTIVTIIYRISQLNRKSLDCLGLQSSKMLPNFNPVYESSHLSDQFKFWLQGHNNES